MDNEIRFRSILGELDYAPKRDTSKFIESRAKQLISSASHLLKLIEESYDTEIAEDLKRRLVKSIATSDEAKFTRKIKQLDESKK